MSASHHLPHVAEIHDCLRRGIAVAGHLCRFWVAHQSSGRLFRSPDRMVSDWGKLAPKHTSRSGSAPQARMGELKGGLEIGSRAGGRDPPGQLANAVFLLQQRQNAADVTCAPGTLGVLNIPAKKGGGG